MTRKWRAPELGGDVRVGDADDVIALDARRRARLALEPLGRRARLQREHLERVALAGVNVLDLVDDAHAPPSNEAHGPVPTGDQRRKVRLRHSSILRVPASYHRSVGRARAVNDGDGPEFAFVSRKRRRLRGRRKVDWRHGFAVDGGRVMDVASSAWKTPQAKWPSLSAVRSSARSRRMRRGIMGGRIALVCAAGRGSP